MKNKIFFVCIIIILGFIGYNEIKYLNDSSNIMLKEIETLENKILDKNLDIDQLNKIESLWVKNEKIYDILLEKEIYKEIGKSISKMRLYYKISDYTKIAEEAGSIRSCLKAIKEDAKISIQNIL